MSIIIARASGTKKHVTRNRGYRLGLDDGIVTPSDEVVGRLERTPGGWYGPRDRLADYRAKRSQTPCADYPEYVERVITFDQGEHVRYVERENRSAKAPKGSKSRATRKPGSARRISNKEVDAFIRAAFPDFRGEISPQIRKLARDEMSHRESVARYAGEL